MGVGAVRLLAHRVRLRLQTDQDLRVLKANTADDTDGAGQTIVTEEMIVFQLLS